MFWSMLFLQAKQNALFGFLLSFCSHDLYPSFSSHFSLKMAPAIQLTSSLTLKTNTEMPEK